MFRKEFGDGKGQRLRFRCSSVLHGKPGCRGAGVSHPHAAHDRAVPAGGRNGHPRPHRGTEAGRKTRSAGDRRQPPRRGHEYRHGARRAVRARRLHLADGEHRACRQSEPLSEDDLRSVAQPGAGDAGGNSADGPQPHPLGTRADRETVHLAGSIQTGKAQLRLLRQRQRRAPCRRTFQDDHGAATSSTSPTKGVGRRSRG